MENNSEEKLNTLLTWEYLDPEPIDRNNIWFLGFGIAFTLLMAWALFTFNWLFFMILLLSAVLILGRILSAPQHVQCTVSEEGITCNNVLTRFSDLNSFWIVYAPGGEGHLYVEYKSYFSPKNRIPIKHPDVEHVRRVLSRFIEEDVDKEEGFDDFFSRFLGL